jgi:hypothetical protein
MTKKATQEYRARVFVGESEESFADALQKAWRLAYDDRVAKWKRSNPGTELPELDEVHVRIVERWATARNPITGFRVAAVVDR